MDIYNIESPVKCGLYPLDVSNTQIALLKLNANMVVIGYYTYDYAIECILKCITKNNHISYKYKKQIMLRFKRLVYKADIFSIYEHITGTYKK